MSWQLGSALAGSFGRFAFVVARTEQTVFIYLFLFVVARTRTNGIRLGDNATRSLETVCRVVQRRAQRRGAAEASSRVRSSPLSATQLIRCSDFFFTPGDGIGCFSTVLVAA